MQAGTVRVLPDGAALIRFCSVDVQVGVGGGGGGGGGVGVEVLGRTASRPAPTNFATSPQSPVATKLTWNGSPSCVWIAAKVHELAPPGSVTVDGTGCVAAPTRTVALAVDTNRTCTSRSPPA